MSETTHYGNVDLTAHPLLKELYRIACLIEAVPFAHETLTNASSAAFDALSPLQDLVTEYLNATKGIPSWNHGPGTLEVGLSKDMQDVVVNHPCLPLDPRGGHLVFSPQQARDFANLLLLKADQGQTGKA